MANRIAVIARKLTTQLLQRHQMLLFRTFDSAQGNRAVQSDKPALVLHGQAKQIQIRELAMTVDFAVVERGSVQKAQVIWPELMTW